MNTLLLGEWLNGRVAVSKTVGCVFESRLPCQIVYRVFRYTIFFTQFISHPQQVASDAFVCSLPVANNAVPSLRSLRIASPLPNRVSCFSVHDFFMLLFLTRNRLRLTLLFARFPSQTTLFRRCAPYESRLPCQIVYRVFRYTIFLRYFFSPATGCV